MKIWLEPSRVVSAITLDGHLVRARRWDGETETGVPVVAYIPRIAPLTDEASVQQQFAEALSEAASPLPKAASPVEHLAAELLLALAPVLKQQPPAREHVYCALNGVAIAAATLLAGADPAGRKFFDDAVAISLAELRGRQVAK